MRVLWVLVWFAGVACAADRIGAIEFFGYQGIDIEAIRRALPFHVDDPYREIQLAQARETVIAVTGKRATQVTEVCCLKDNGHAIFIGLAGGTYREVVFHPAPSGADRLAPEAAALYRKMRDAEDEAVRKGDSQEDATSGYRLSRNPSARAAELKVRDYALEHAPSIERVLSSARSAEQRAMAADYLGYTARSPAQIAALVGVALDPDDVVRNNATRALGEILHVEPVVAAYVDPGPYLALVRSGIWSDRNKGCWVLLGLTQSKSPALLERIRTEAWDVLLEMAAWPPEWAGDARFALARLAGIPESEWASFLTGPAEEFRRRLGVR